MNLGQRTAPERMAHLLCEIFFRLRLARQLRVPADTGGSRGRDRSVQGSCQPHPARAAGCWTHRLKGKTLVVPSLDRLMNTGLFNSNYLHMEYEGRQLDSNE